MNKRKQLVLLFTILSIVVIIICAASNKRGSVDTNSSQLQIPYSETTNAENAQNLNIVNPDSTPKVTDKEKQAFIKKCRELGKIYKDIYLQAEKTPSIYVESDYDITQAWKDKIEDVLIESCYSVINTDSVYPEYLERSEGVYCFWDSVKSNKDAQTEFWGVSSDGGLNYTCLSFKDGTPICTHAFAKWNDDNEMIVNSIEKREIYFWNMTQGKDFYYQDLRLDRHWSATKLIRLNPVDHYLYDMNMKYIEPIGYQNVNMFLLDWEQNNYGNVCFNDLLEGLYRAEHGDYLYTNNYPCVNEPYFHFKIPAKFFEDTIRKHFNIGIDEFRKRTLYDNKSNTYPWQDINCNNITYYPSIIPEVVSCEKVNKGKIKLTVRVMCLDYHSDCVLTHELTVRELSDGGWQYLSNHIIARDDVEQPSSQARIEAQRTLK